MPKGGHWTVQVRRHDVDDRQHQEPGGKPWRCPMRQRGAAKCPGMEDADGAHERRRDCSLNDPGKEGRKSVRQACHLAPAVGAEAL